ncbi:MAG: hypothetical protein LBI42_04270 [Chitinispirillales bacterium]|nr:hypothetical protein [Chitinispirillales bacterium]
MSYKVKTRFHHQLPRIFRVRIEKYQLSDSIKFQVVWTNQVYISAGAFIAAGS